VYVAEEGQIEDAPLALDAEWFVLARGKHTTLANMQPALRGKEARAEADHVLAIRLGDLVEAVMHVLQALDGDMLTEEVGLQRRGLKLGEKADSLTRGRCTYGPA